MSAGPTITALREVPAPRRGPRVVLVGPMGAGKTSVGRALAARLGVPFVDTDAEVEDLTGLAIADIFAQWGQERFRRIEARTIARLLSDSEGVLALGGGALTDPGTAQLLVNHRVVLLTVDAARVAERIGGGQRRPVLAGPDPLARWAQVTAERADAYAAAAVWRIDTTGSTVADIADALAGELAAGGMDDAGSGAALDEEIARIHVSTASGGYLVHVGRQLYGHIPAMLPERARTVMIIHQPSVRTLAEELREQIQATGRSAYLAEVPDAEQGKTAQVLAFLWQVLGQADVGRSDLIIGMGGGAATDLAGFAAASWLRGIDVLQVPTTVAGMVDAAIGGKTGINTAEGKNLVGAFHPPIGVVADLDVLAGLPAHDVAAGLAEIVKAGFIQDPEILRITEADPRAVLDTGSEAFADVLVRAIAVKADVVGEDLTEQGRREFLNYGHTLAHAIERNERYQWRHGAAVSVGMVFAAELAGLAGRLSEADVDRHRRVLTSLGLPVTYRDRQWPALLEAMKRDKKTRGGMLRFIVLDGIARPSRLEGPDPALLLAAYDAIVGDES